ncbi:MAG: HDOD domain-containing protein [Thermodesulfobacteriota bacterium]|nr:HDOD domain-containing protein [Thermodesulfobacteriota bacterium]
MDSKMILKRLDGIDDLPTLPTIAVEVNSMLQDYDTSITKLSETIKKDQAIIPRILKLVNSSFYGFQSKVSDIGRAIVLLGFNTVRNAIVTISIIDAFSRKGGLAGFNITDFWTHSVAVAVTSRHLAHRARLQSPEDYFTGGLLHDIGKIVLLQYFQDLFEKVWISARENNLSFYDAEKEEIRITHARIGAHLAKKWQLPEPLVDTIRYHHAVNKTAKDLNLLMIVHVADIIVNSIMTDSKDDIDSSAIDPEAARTMKSQLETVSTWFPEVSEEIQSACRFFLQEGAQQEVRE